jgi:hypothetical protein
MQHDQDHEHGTAGHTHDDLLNEGRGVEPTTTDVSDAAMTGTTPASTTQTDAYAAAGTTDRVGDVVVDRDSVANDDRPDRGDREHGTEALGAGMGALGGAAVGMAVGGPPGAVVGGAIGAVGGAVAGEAAEGDDEAGSGTGALGGGAAGAVIGGAIAGPPGAVVGGSVGAGAGAGAGDTVEDEAKDVHDGRPLSDSDR